MKNLTPVLFSIIITFSLASPLFAEINQPPAVPPSNPAGHPALSLGCDLQRFGTFSVNACFELPLHSNFSLSFSLSTLLVSTAYIPLTAGLRWYPGATREHNGLIAGMGVGINIARLSQFEIPIVGTIGYRIPLQTFFIEPYAEAGMVVLTQYLFEPTPLFTLGLRAGIRL